MVVRPFYALALLAGLLAAPFPAAAQATKLRATLQLPITDVLTGKALARFKEDVEKRSNGAISIKTSPTTQWERWPDPDQTARDLGRPGSAIWRYARIARNAFFSLGAA